jgi:hypothetical protein
MRRVTEIKILTWPALWQYWPIYVGFASAKKLISEKYGRELKLYTLNDQIVSDELLFNVFSANDEYDFGLFGIPKPAAPTDGNILSTPVIKRQPHWVYVKNIGTVNQVMGAVDTAVVYPVGTTSRRLWDAFVYQSRQRRTGIRFPRFSNGVQLTIHPWMLNKRSNLSTNQLNELEQLLGLKRGEMIITYTPWHSAPNIQKTLRKERIICSQNPVFSYNDSVTFIHRKSSRCDCDYDGIFQIIEQEVKKIYCYLLIDYTQMIDTAVDEHYESAESIFMNVYIEKGGSGDRVLVGKDYLKAFLKELWGNRGYVDDQRKVVLCGVQDRRLCERCGHFDSHIAGT